METGAFCTPPGRAACALRNAKTLADWREAEVVGMVRIGSEPDDGDDYFAIYGSSCGYTDLNGRRVTPEQEENEMRETIERLGCWVVWAQFWNGEDWEQADSVGMCIYENPESPFENCYVPDLMESALRQIPMPGQH